jgi:prephenate dehydrogenase
MFRKLVVVGVGLLGGSVALAARRHNLAREIVGYGRNKKKLRLAKRKKIIDDYVVQGDDIPDGVDFLILATPVQTIVPIVGSFLHSIEPGCIISDVGSVKEKIVRDAEKLLPDRVHFVGAHPIAGSEKSGAEAAVPGLFLGHRCIITPTRKTDPKALRKVSLFWRRVGAKVEIMDPHLHDRILAIVSHLPHVLAYTLVNSLSRHKLESVDLKRYCGGGFKDLTRIASSPPEIWRDICLDNRQAITKSIQDYIKHLEQLRRWIREGERTLLERDFARANQLRGAIL